MHELGKHDAGQEAERGFNVSRRTFLQLGSFAALGTVVAARTDAMIGEMMWQTTTTELQAYRDFSARDIVQPWLTAPGLGMKSGRYVSKELDAIGVNSAYFVLPDQNASTSGMKDAARKLVGESSSVNLAGASMGGPILLDMVRRGAPRRIATVALLSSPFDIDDARFTPGAKTLDIAYRAGYSGGPGGHALYRLLVDLQQGRLYSESVRSEAEKIAYEIGQGNPLSVTLSGIHMLSRVNLADRTAEYAERGLVAADSRLYYVRSTRSEADTVVDVAQAEEKWAAFAKETGARFEPVRVDDMPHGDARMAIAALRRQIA